MSGRTIPSSLMTPMRSRPWVPDQPRDCAPTPLDPTGRHGRVGIDTSSSQGRPCRTARRNSSRSRRDRATGPIDPAIPSAPGMTPLKPPFGSLEELGLKPNNPQLFSQSVHRVWVDVWVPYLAAGTRVLPPMSVVMPRGAPCEATSAASPPELPPLVRFRLCGLVVTPMKDTVSSCMMLCGLFVFA